MEILIKKTSCYKGLLIKGSRDTLNFHKQKRFYSHWTESADHADALVRSLPRNQLTAYGSCYHLYLVITSSCPAAVQMSRCCVPPAATPPGPLDHPRPHCGWGGGVAWRARATSVNRVASCPRQANRSVTIVLRFYCFTTDWPPGQEDMETATAQLIGVSTIVMDS